MGVHLGLVVQREEAFQQGKDVRHSALGDAGVLDVEEAALCASVVDLLCDRFALVEGPVDVRDVDCWDRREARGVFCYFAVGGFLFAC
jgi:hypothetical protein